MSIKYTNHNNFEIDVSCIEVQTKNGADHIGVYPKERKKHIVSIIPCKKKSGKPSKNKGT